MHGMEKYIKNKRQRSKHISDTEPQVNILLSNQVNCTPCSVIYIYIPRTQHDYHHDTKVKLEAVTAVIELLMMCGKTPETCSAVNKRQDNKLKNCCIWLVIYLNCSRNFLGTSIIQCNWLNTNNKNFTPSLGVASPLFVNWCLSDDEWRREPKHVAVLNKNDILDLYGCVYRFV
jgi:hypothetical protein